MIYLKLPKTKLAAICDYLSAKNKMSLYEYNTMLFKQSYCIHKAMPNYFQMPSNDMEKFKETIEKLDNL